MVENKDLKRDRFSNPFLINLKKKEAHLNWENALFLYLIISIIHFSNVLFKNIIINLIGMSLYLLFTLIFVKKSEWKNIKIKGPSNKIFFLIGCVSIALLFIIEFFIRILLFDFNSLNYLVLMGKQQAQYGVVTNANKWDYFLIAELGFCIISPFTEELFFRGLVLKSFEEKTSKFKANIIQAFLFSFVHTAYYWMIELNIWYLLINSVWISTGLIFGWFCQKTDSILSSIVMHIIHNFLAILFVYLYIIPVLF